MNPVRIPSGPISWTQICGMQRPLRGRRVGRNGGLNAQRKSERRKGPEDRRRYRRPRVQGAAEINRIRQGHDARRDRVRGPQKRCSVRRWRACRQASLIVIVAASLPGIAQAETRTTIAVMARGGGGWRLCDRHRAGDQATIENERCYCDSDRKRHDEETRHGFH